MTQIVRGADGKFPKGVSGNPRGRQRTPWDLQELQSIAKNEVIDAINSTVLMDRDQLRALVADPAASVAKLIIASVVQRAIQDGCAQRANFLVNYIVGKPKDLVMLEDEELPSAQKVLKGVPSSILIELVKSAKSE